MRPPDDDGANRLRAIARRLREMSRREGPPAPAPPPAAPARRRQAVRLAAPRLGAPSGHSLTLEETASGTEVETPRGRVQVVVGRLEQADPQWARVGEEFAAQLARPESNLRRLITCSGAPDARAEDLLFVDLETTGLEAAAPLFLIGSLQWDGEGFVVRQCLARNYDEEPAAISEFQREAEQARLLVSFNGTTFDVPFLRSRAMANRLCPPRLPAHLDLLPLCRRAWRRHLPNCRLTTLEVYICGRERRGDLPGSAIPEVYHEYVRTGDAALIGPILAHNVVDLGTMADLMLRLPGGAD